MKKDDELSLENLAMPACFSDPKALAEIPRVDLDKQLMTREEILATLPRYNVSMKTVNTCIYDGSVVSGMGTGIPRLRRLQFERMKSLFGLTDDALCYEWLRSHGRHSDAAHDALLADAFQTGKFEELPDGLQNEYHAGKEVES